MIIKFKDWFYNEGLAIAGDYKGGLFQRLVAASYHLAPVMDSSVEPAWIELARKLQRQNEFLRHKFNFIPSSGDHYSSMKQLKQSIDAQRATGQKKADMFVYAEPPGPEGEEERQGHPIWSNDTNVMVRGVHDAIAHLAGNHPFSARGEYAAYNRHAKTLCNVQDAKAGKCMAVHALFTEIVGQTSFYYIYGKFPPQKVAFLNDFDHYNVGLLSSASGLNAFFEYQNKNLVAKQDFNPQIFQEKFPQLNEVLQGQRKRRKLNFTALPGSQSVNNAVN